MCIDKDLPVFADDLEEYFKRIPSEDGRYILALHGNPNRCYLYGIAIDEIIIGNIIRSRKDYHNEEIVLISCNTGNVDNKGNCIAQRLANYLNKIVYAPPSFAAINGRGEYYVSDRLGRKTKGEFKEFKPEQKEK